MTLNVRWTVDEDDFLRNNHGKFTYHELAIRLNKKYKNNRTWDAVKTRCVLIGLMRPNGCMVNNKRDNEYMIKVWSEL